MGTAGTARNPEFRIAGLKTGYAHLARFSRLLSNRGETETRKREHIYQLLHKVGTSGRGAAMGRLEGVIPELGNTWATTQIPSQAFAAVN